jgi:hopanoid biosynthesis associated radical SAM protein HpnH
MPVPLRQTIAVGSYIIKQKLKGNKHYPLVTMLEPLFRCNLACSGCGKIQYPEEVLKQTLTPQQCFDAVEDSGSPLVNVAGGEPLIHPQIKEIIDGLIERKKFVYFCTNALLLKRKLHLFKPSDQLTFVIHLDGLEDHHDACVSRKGTYKIAIEAIKEAKALGFRVCTNTTIFEGHPSEDVRNFFDEVMKMGVDGLIFSPGYSYEKAPNQEKFLKREKSKQLFKEILEGSEKRGWEFNLSPLYIDFLKGEKDYDCTPWGCPNYTIFGWQKPCYLMSDGGYVATYKELIETTKWEDYGVKSGNPKCQNCMVSCGFEPTAVNDSMSSLKNMIRSASAIM